MEQLQKLQYLSLVSKVTSGACPGRGSSLGAGPSPCPPSAHAALVGAPLPAGIPATSYLPGPPAELENHLGLADKTLSEFIIELSKGKGSVKEFRLELRENGADMPDALVDTLWAIIQKMMPGRGGGVGGGGGGSGGGSGLQPRPDAPYSGLAMPDTRDRVKQMEEEMLAEAREKAEASAAAERQRGPDGGSARDGRGSGGLNDDRYGRDGRDSRDGNGRDRERDRGRYDDRDRRERRRSRSRSRDRDRGRHDDRDRYGGRGGRGRSRSASPRGRGAPPPMPDEAELYGVYKVGDAAWDCLALLLPPGSLFCVLPLPDGLQRSVCQVVLPCFCAAVCAVAAAVTPAARGAGVGVCCADAALAKHLCAPQLMSRSMLIAATAVPAALLQGRVTGVMDFGCFVELQGFRTKQVGTLAFGCCAALVPPAARATGDLQASAVKLFP